MSFNYQNLTCLSRDTWGGAETLEAPASATVYSKPYQITHLDSVHGIFSTFVGSRYGVNNVVITMQDAPSADTPSAAWTDVGSGVNFSSGGTQGSPVTATLITEHKAASGSTIKPFIRFKIVSGAATAGSFTKILRTTRGLKLCRFSLLS
jgi:hypothetical protein